MKVTGSTITDDDIRELRQLAVAIGNASLQSVCDLALGDGFFRSLTRAECANYINAMYADYINTMNEVQS